jgi:hypothetical protein
LPAIKKCTQKRKNCTELPPPGPTFLPAHHHPSLHYIIEAMGGMGGSTPKFL